MVEGPAYRGHGRLGEAHRLRNPRQKIHVPTSTVQQSSCCPYTFRIRRSSNSPSQATSKKKTLQRRATSKQATRSHPVLLHAKRRRAKTTSGACRVTYLPLTCCASRSVERAKRVVVPNPQKFIDQKRQTKNISGQLGGEQHPRLMERRRQEAS